MSLVVTLIIFTGCLIFGIKLWKRSRLFSLFLIVPVFLILLFVGYGVFNSWYHTREEPMDSLEFWIKEIELK
ncbi:hypothetical protein [Bacillus sp. MUM 13]|uniref:hypothetical protein n=1 Tax=Bacillus sp. MUM 13 TaxID=1678001 RepID=UPI0008F583D0|nr:hypothetical protein [Bacillus sp. MUM 13]OIK04290.1 hypothetical protein BIV59_22180 [Bacillus sp. MUM 13]